MRIRGGIVRIFDVAGVFAECAIFVLEGPRDDLRIRVILIALDIRVGDEDQTLDSAVAHVLVTKVPYHVVRGHVFEFIDNDPFVGGNLGCALLVVLGEVSGVADVSIDAEVLHELCATRTLISKMEEDLPSRRT